jgi:LAO/AO transport system kinase
LSPTLDQLEQGVLAAEAALLARAITLTESVREADRKDAQVLLQRLLPKAGGSVRIGISGAPGVGKSTFIEAFGSMLCDEGHRVAVLAVDPSSARSGGSILGDKSRMARLAQNPNAFIRPSPSARTLGGVGRRTRESMLLCEAAGFDIVLIETVGVGQSETMVSEMVDFFLLLMQPGAGDELQGIKRGIVELADCIAVNKADGANLPLAREAAQQYGAALRYLTPRSEHWRPQAVMVSAKEGTGLAELWTMITAHRRALTDAGEFDLLRKRQLLQWMWSQIEEQLQASFRAHPDVQALLDESEAAVQRGDTTPAQAAEALLRAFRQ